jgi:hypothetical protein
MNRYIRLLLENGNKVNGVIALAIISLIVLGCTCGKDADTTASNTSTAENRSSDNPFGDDADTADGADGLPGERLRNALVKATTAEFAQAVSTGDFSNVHANASIDFQKAIPIERLEREFKPFVDQKKRYLPSLAKLSSTEPEYSPEPSLRSEQGLDILVVKGKFPTSPLDVEFDYEYVKRGGTWKLLKLVVKM